MRVRGYSLEAQNDAAEIRLRAERRIGSLLKEQEKQRPGEYQRSHDVTVAPSLADQGITKMQATTGAPRLEHGTGSAMPEAWEGLVSIPNVRAISVGLALICELPDGRRFSTPVDLIGPDSQVRSPGDFGTLEVVRWFAREQGLIS